jgi:serine/threonine protein kinase
VEFKERDKIALDNAEHTVTIVKKLGSGAQGIVYEVTMNGKSYALKWYTDGEILKNTAFKKNLIKNIDERKSPDHRFLWPLYLTAEKDGSYGYIMGLCPKEFSKFPGILNNIRRFDSYDVMLAAALNLASAFRVLHTKGLSYQDLNKGSFFINVKSGAVLICDNDNVSSGGEGNSARIKGMQGYWAPEIVTEKVTHPSTETDRHSLAVVLFLLFIHQHPLYGKKTAEGDGMPDPKVFEGTNPVFIFDPKNDSNRPILPEPKGAPGNWAVLPPYVRELFEQAFGEGLREPTKRPTELQWQQALLRFRDEYIGDQCPNPQCLGGDLTDSKISHLYCKKCGKTFDQPARFQCGDYLIPLLPGKKIYGYHVDKTADLSVVDYMSVAGEVFASGKTPGLLGIKNLSKNIWHVAAPNGENITVAHNQVVSIKCGSEITFKNTTAQIVFQFSTGTYTVPLYPGQKLYADTKADTKTVIAEVITSKNNLHKWGLKNLSSDAWTYKSIGEEQGKVGYDEVMSIARGCQINFGSMSGKITG